MSKRDFNRYPEDNRKRPEDLVDEHKRDEKWDREHFERSMDSVRDSQKDDAGYSSPGGSQYPGGVLSSSSYGGGAEFYSVTGMYENPLLDKNKKSHRGKGPRGYTRADDRIMDDVVQRLTHDHYVDASLVVVEVKDGEVTLSGEVSDRGMRHRAEDIAADVSGVRDVHNSLKVLRNNAA